MSRITNQGRKLRIDIASVCDPGIERRDEPNQDAVVVIMPSLINHQPPLLMVADGMGGQNGSAVAGKLLIEVFLRRYRSVIKKNIVTTIYSCYIIAHNAIKSKVKKSKQDLSRMGTTAVVAVIDGYKLYISNVGDSRAYLINEETISQLSWDQSIVAGLVRAGEITPDEAKEHPDRSRLTMAISAPRDQIEPYINIYDISAGDTVLLCSDGLWGVVSDEIIHKVVVENSPHTASKKLLEIAFDNGGPDNISIIVA